MDFALYWFMFPVSICVATTAMLSGIGGAALFMPIFLLIFPLLGADYVLGSAATAIAAALVTQTFGFASGFISYQQQRLIDYRQAMPFLTISVPTAIIGSVVSHLLEPAYIRASYGVLMLVLATHLFHGFRRTVEQPLDVTGTRILFDSSGKEYRYTPYRVQKKVTGLGGFLSGLLSTGIGEVVMPQLIKHGRLPMPVAAATSVLIVIVTVISASATHLATLISASGLDAVPWNLICYTVPGVIIGGQIGPRLQGRVSTPTMQISIAVLFAGIGVAMLLTVFGTP